MLWVRKFFVLVSSIAIASCSGSSDSGPSRYHIGGTVSGLRGTGLVLHGSQGEDLAISANGAFTFKTPVDGGSAYAVTVSAQPTSPWQTCTVTRGSGTAGGEVTDVAVTCATNSYAVGGTVSGLLGTGLVLRNGGEDLSVLADGTFVFATRVASGAAFDVTVAVSPTGPAQACVVESGSGTVAGADVRAVTVTCSTRSFSVGGTIAGLVGTGLVLRNGAEDLAVASAATAFEFVNPLASGEGYAVTVAVQPSSPSQLCTVGNGTGTVGAGDVADVTVSCVTTFTIGGTISGLVASGLVLHNGTEDLPVAGGATSFRFAGRVPTGGAYEVTATQPTTPAQTCTLAAASGVVGAADVTDVSVTCDPPVVLQRWAAPTTWGAPWTDDDLALLQHAHFDATGIVETTAGITWSAPGGDVPRSASQAFPTPRHGAGPFAAGLRFEAAGDARLDAAGDVIVCAVFKPDLDPVVDGAQRVIFAKGLQGVDGWVLMQAGQTFAFAYQNDSATPGNLGAPGQWMAFTKTQLGDAPGTGPLNPSFEVVCAGRDGDVLRVAANSVPARFAAANDEVALAPGALVPAAGRHATIGGYGAGALPGHVFGGIVYETAVWSLPATPANLQAKLAAALGLVMDNGVAAFDGVARYSRLSEGPYGADAAGYHTAPRNAPRIDPAKGLLFGLQGWNRIAEPEALDLWTRTGSASVTADVAPPPGDAGLSSADEVTLPPGGAISPVLAAPLFSLPLFAAASPVYGQLWIQPISASGTLRIRNAAVDGVQQDVDLSTLPAGTWSRVFITGLRSAATPADAFVLENPIDGAADIRFLAWGADLTQFAGGSTLPADPGLAMYAWGTTPNNANVFEEDYLALPPIGRSTATTGYCLSVDAEPAAGLGWTSTFRRPRTAIAWTASDGSASSDIHLQETISPARLCFNTRSGDDVWFVCSNTPPTSAGPHNVKGCVAPDGTMTLHVDGVLQTDRIVGRSVGAPTTVFVPDLATGSIVLGNGGSGANRAWYGYVSGALACSGTDPAQCAW